MTTFRSARVQVVILASLCFITANFGWFLASERHAIAPFWPPSGVALAFLLLWGRGLWPAVFVGTLAAHILVSAFSPLSLTGAIGNTIEAFLGVTIIRSFIDFDASLRRLNDLAVLLLAVLASTFVGAAIGAGAIYLSGRAAWAEFPPMFATWWLGDGMGALLLVPVILTWAHWTPRRVRPAAVAEALLLLLALLVAASLAFAPDRPHLLAHTALEYLPFPLIIWAAIRFDVRGAATASAVLGIYSLVSFAHSSPGGPVGGGLLPMAQANALLLIQTSVAVLLLTGLVTAAIHTERNDAMRALRESEERYRTLYNKTPVMLHSIDADSRIISVSDYWLQMLGYTRQEVLGHRSPEFMAPESSLRSSTINLPAFISGVDMQDIEYQFVRKDGTVMDVMLNAVAEREPGGRLRRSMTVLTDITRRNRAEEERRQMALNLQEARQLESLGLLAGGIAHDFSNLLTSIVGNANLARETLTGHPVTTHLDEIERAASRATALVRQIQAYAGHGRLQVRAVDLNALVQDVASTETAEMPAHVTVQLRLASALPAIAADPTQVRQVISNLVDNAVEAIRDRPGSIQLTTRLIHADRPYLASSHLAPDVPAGPYVALDVMDDGGGMSVETRARVFDPFFTTKFTGRGLGLAAVLGIVRGHLGAVWVTSEEGSGTTVRVLLPVADIADATARPPAPTPSAAAATVNDDDNGWRTAGSALVVDDESSVRTVLQRMLGNHGLSVITAADGEEGLALFRAHRVEISVILLDLTMPGMDGDEVYRRVREIDAAVPIVMMTGFSHQEASARCAALDVTALLQKPFRIDELIDVVRQTLRPPTA